MKTIIIPLPGRLRHVPRQFSWIDQRLVRDRHIQGRSPDALALYLFLCTVADAQGASFYSDTSMARLLSFGSTQLRTARAELVASGLIAWRSPFYQVLSLEPGHDDSSTPEVVRSLAEKSPLSLAATPAPAPAPAPAPEPTRSMVALPLHVAQLRAIGGVQSIGDIVRTMIKEAREGRTS